jgi:uncharacterized tellurite resistance protein B-like protein
MIFKNPGQTKSGLTRNEREAIIDLLNLCIYADAHIALKESEFMESVIETIGWDVQSSFDSYNSRSIAAARNARGSDEQQTDLIAFANERLKTGTARRLAVELCQKLFRADGVFDDKEYALLDAIRAALK